MAITAPSRRNGPSIAAARAPRRSSSARSAPTITATRIPASTTWGEGVTPIPAAALSIPDAEQLQRMLERGQPVTMRLLLTPRYIGIRQSGNVVAEVPGSDPQRRHRPDRRPSRQLGPRHRRDRRCRRSRHHRRRGQADHGRRAGRGGRSAWSGSAPRKSEASAARAYRAAHKDENIVWSRESDFGADRVWRMDSGFVAPNTAARRPDRRGAGAARNRPRRDRGERRRRSRRRGSAPEWRRSTSSRTAPAISTSPHARRHARQGRSRAAEAECRRLDGDAGARRQRAGGDRAQNACALRAGVDRSRIESGTTWIFQWPACFPAGRQFRRGRASAAHLPDLGFLRGDDIFREPAKLRILAAA